ncbi:MAG: spore germination protein [Firmicutes bacterium]|nr:spore germination protein [Bacillota bacterium]
MQNTKEQISSHQLGYMIIFMAVIVHIIALPAQMAEAAGRDAWIVIAAYFLINAAAAALILWVHRIYPGKTLFELVEACAGKIFSRVFAGVLGAYFLTRFYINFFGVEKFMIYNLYGNVSWRVFIVPAAIALVFIAGTGLKSLARASELLGLAVLALIVLAVLFLCYKIKIYNFLPVFGDGLRPAAAGFAEYISVWGDFLPLLMFIGHFKKGDKIARGAVWGLTVAGLILVIMNILFICFYGNLAKYQYHGQALRDLAQFAAGSNSLARLDFLLLLAWLGMGFVNLGIFAFCILQCIHTALNLHGGAKGKTVSAVICAVLIIAYSTVFGMLEAQQYYYGPAKYVLSIPFCVLLPASVPVLALVAKRKDNAHCSNAAMKVK